MDTKQDFFISHASTDKPGYIQPLAECLAKRGVTFWLDNYEIQWGDSFALKINEGLRESRHFILCLSEAFLSRPWPEAELSAALTAKAASQDRKVLPLILNSTERVLAQYPLLASMIYREYRDPDSIAQELAHIAKRHAQPPGYIRVSVESVHTGRLSNIDVSPQASVRWLADMAKRGAGLRDTLDTGGFDGFRVRWVLVDVNAEDDWRSLERWDRVDVHAMVKAEDGVRVAAHGRQRLEELGVRDKMVFHLYAVEDNDDMVCYAKRATLKSPVR